MIETYKILAGKEHVDKNKYFQSASFRGRWHSKKLVKRHTWLDVRKNYFTQRVTNYWNSLCDDEINAQKTGDFKKKYSRVRQYWAAGGTGQLDICSEKNH